MADRKRSRSLLERAYDLQTSDEALSLYRDWATSYDTDLVDPLRYVVPARVSLVLATRRWMAWISLRKCWGRRGTTLRYAMLIN